MAFVTFDGAQAPVSMTDGNLARFGSGEAAFATVWSWRTPTGHDLDLSGSGMTFDGQGHATGGRVTRVQVDIGNNGFGMPDILVTGLNVLAAPLDDSPEAFWNAVLAGNDIIDATGLAKDTISRFNNSLLFGDDLRAVTGPSRDTVTDRGGNDVITLGDARYIVAGDAFTATGDVLAGTFVRYAAGNDQLLAQATQEEEQLVGDVFDLGPNTTLLGGDDLLQFANGFTAIGDVFRVNGSGLGLARIEGGDDRLEAGRARPRPSSATSSS